MKKKKSYIVIALIAMFVTGYNVYTSQKKGTLLTALDLANVEALANETEGTPITIYMCYHSVSSAGTESWKDKRYCGTCNSLRGRIFEQISNCQVRSE
jgi:hypothetical protein